MGIKASSTSGQRNLKAGENTRSKRLNAEALASSADSEINRREPQDTGSLSAVRVPQSLLLQGASSLPAAASAGLAAAQKKAARLELERRQLARQFPQLLPDLDGWAYFDEIN